MDPINSYFFPQNMPQMQSLICNFEFVSSRLIFIIKATMECQPNMHYHIECSMLSNVNPAINKSYDAIVFLPSWCMSQPRSVHSTGQFEKHVFLLCRKRQINKPRPVDAEDMEAIYKQAKEEQDKADQTFLEEHQGQEISDFEKLNLDSHSASLGGMESNTSVKPRGRSRKAMKPSVDAELGKSNVKLLVPGSTVQVVSGAFAGFSGILKKFDKKTGLVFQLS